MRRNEHYFVADYGMQVTILNRYGIRNYGVLGKDYNLRGYSQNTKYEQQLVIEVKGVGSFFCGYALVYNGGTFKVCKWDADSEFDLNCDMALYKRLEEIFHKYCGR